MLQGGGGSLSGAPRGSWLHWGLAAAATLLAQHRVWLALPVLFGPGATLLGDGWWHAMAARSIAEGIPHGWIDASDGGFPVGPYYPVGGWLLTALLIRLGCGAATALQLVGVGGTLATPLVFLFVARSVGARPMSALAGAVLLAWVSPFTYFVASSVSFVFGGLISQTVHSPILLLWIRSLVRSERTRTLPALAALMTVAHPQVTIAAFLVTGVATLVARSRVLFSRYLVSAAAVALVGIAVFGRGLSYKHLPLGWPPMEAWRSAGFGPDMALTLYGRGQLLDQARLPVLTCAWAAALVVLAATARQRSHAAILAASIAAAAFAVSGGEAFVRAGSALPIVLQALMPARMLAIVPLAAAAAIVVASDRGLARLDIWSRRTDRPGDKRVRRGLANALPVALLLVAALYCSAGSAQAFYERLVAAGDEGFVAASCAADVPAHFDASEVTGWIRALDRGRFDIDAHAPFDKCRRVEPLRLASHVPVGRGAFPGILMAAFANVRPWLPGSAARAEALGVRALLRGPGVDPAADGGWKIRASSRDAVMAERLGGTDTVGVGCIDETWSGSDEALRDAIVEDLQVHARILDPTSLVALDRNESPFVATRVARGSCSPDEAVVFERRREPGAYEATVDARTEVDVVVRATDFPTWQVTVDGAPAKKRSVAPGFFATRVGPGHHEVVALFAPIPFYLGGILIALLLVAALCLVAL